MTTCTKDIHEYSCIRAHARACVCMCLCLFMCVCMCVCACVCLGVYACMRTCVRCVRKRARTTEKSSYYLVIMLMPYLRWDRLSSCCKVSGNTVGALSR